jgi:hypothetical protein
VKRFLVGMLTVCSFAMSIGVAQAQPDTAACSEAITRVTLATTAKINADTTLKTAQDLVVKVQSDLTAAMAKIPPDAALITKLTADLGAAVNGVITPQKAAVDAATALNVAVDTKNKACNTPPVTVTATPTVIPRPSRPNVSAGVNTGAE